MKGRKAEVSEGCRDSALGMGTWNARGRGECPLVYYSWSGVASLVERFLDL